MKTYQKIILTILLAAVASYLFGCMNYPVYTAADTLHENRPTVASLNLAYRDANRDFFYGGLPESKTKVALLDLTPQGWMGNTTQFTDGTWQIDIDIKSHPLEKEAEMTLIHEMCHQDSRISGADQGLDGHSGAFEACMVHVAERGGFKGLW